MNMIVSRAWGTQAEDGADCPLTFLPVAITMETGSKKYPNRRGIPMKFFIDTANVEEIRKANDMGVICGVTTNPSLIAKEGKITWRP